MRRREQNELREDNTAAVTMAMTIRTQAAMRRMHHFVDVKPTPCLVSPINSRIPNRAEPNHALKNKFGGSPAETIARSGNFWLAVLMSKFQSICFGQFNIVDDVPGSMSINLWIKRRKRHTFSIGIKISGPYRRGAGDLPNT
ncbi:uncharacterized protein ARMOST_16790 [Armillaria ostoyae]|uniref:Uncharacterized protein n=1 Tax=Armillaria ostoyae TaxID=47428 RepID=A0A284RX71_ARMOS|nr:uncharacterized protein ARMOST_16790 [Armillaria ostoyae]